MSSSFGPSGSEEAKDEDGEEVSGSLLESKDDSFTSDGGTHEQSAARANKETTRLLFLIGSFSFVMPNSRGIWALLTYMTTKSVKSVHKLNDFNSASLFLA